MFNNYFKTAYRNLLKSKVFTTINILGLSVGLAVSLLIFLYVSFERSYDDFQPNADRVYRLRYERVSKDDGQAVRFASCCPPAAPAIREQFPEIEKIGRVYKSKAIVSVDNIKFTEERIFFTEPDVAEILDINFLSGNPLAELADVNKAFLSESTAQKYFGNDNPVGKTITLDGKTDYQVVGVFADSPANSHIKFDFILSFKNIELIRGPEVMQAWGHTGFFTYLRLRPDADITALKTKLADLVEREFGEVLDYYNLTCELPLQPVTDIHLKSNFMQEYEINGDYDAVNILFIISIFIVLMAWINYVNLSTSKALTRAKEVGLRKVVGASRKQLMFQFLFEVILIQFFSIVLALIIIRIALPFFVSFTGLPADYPLWEQSWFWYSLVILFFAGTTVSGILPVATMSAFNPITVMKGKLNSKGRKVNLRKVLLVWQYALAIALITSTLTVHEQISFMKNQKLGFNIEQVLVFNAPRVRDETYPERVNTFKNNLIKNGLANKAAHVTEVPGRQIVWDNGGIFRVGADQSESKNYYIVGIDYDFADLFDLELAVGRNFSREFGSDNEALILNETAVKTMGFESAESAIGKQVNYWENIYTVIGVFKDYHQQSLKVDYEPQIYRLLPAGYGPFGMYAVSVNTQNVTQTLESIGTEYASFFPGNPFDYFFLDDYFNQQYQSDLRFGEIVGLFSGMAIFITALGLFGLSLFSTSQRLKEVGIRKVLGADVLKIFTLFAKEFIVLTIVSALVVLPFTYYALVNFLNEYAFRINLSAELFVIPLFLVLLVTLVTISFQVIKAATVNPIKVLKYE